MDHPTLCPKCKNSFAKNGHSIHSTLAYSRCRCHRLFRYYKKQPSSLSPSLPSNNHLRENCTPENLLNQDSSRKSVQLQSKVHIGSNRQTSGLSLPKVVARLSTSAVSTQVLTLPEVNSLGVNFNGSTDPKEPSTSAELRKSVSKITSTCISAQGATTTLPRITRSTIADTTRKKDSVAEIIKYIPTPKRYELKHLFTAMDKNGDGHLTFSEFLCSLPKTSVVTEGDKECLRKLYSTLGESTYFGYREFIVCFCVAEKLQTLRSSPKHWSVETMLTLGCSSIATACIKKSLQFSCKSVLLQWLKHPETAYILETQFSCTLKNLRWIAVTAPTCTAALFKLLPALNNKYSLEQDIQDIEDPHFVTDNIDCENDEVRTFGSAVQFGSLIQLQDATTKNFLCAAKRRELHQANENTNQSTEEIFFETDCVFKVLPQYENLSLDQVVHYGDTVLLLYINFKGSRQNEMSIPTLIRVMMATPVVCSNPEDVCSNTSHQEEPSAVIQQLVRHVNPKLKLKHPKKKMLRNLIPIPKILSDLQVDFPTHPDDPWLHDFISEPNCGHVALINLVKDLADTPTSLPRKNKRKYAVLDRHPDHFYSALLCLKELIALEAGCRAVLNHDPSLRVLVTCFDSQNFRDNTLIIEIMSEVLHVEGGYDRVMDAFSYAQITLSEPVKYQTLISSLMKGGDNPTYQVALLRFINQCTQAEEGPNARVFHQHEFKLAGFNPFELENSLCSGQDDGIQNELSQWYNNYIDVQQCMNSLCNAEEKVLNLQEELTKTQNKMHEYASDIDCLRDQEKKLIDQNQLLDDETKALEMKCKQLEQELRSTQKHLYDIRLEKEHLHEQIKQMNTDIPATTDKAVEEILTPPCSPVPPAPPPPPTPPPAPPPAPPPVPSPMSPARKRIIPHVPLPVLNWHPIRNSQGTLFKDLNYEAVLKKVDITEFEELFKLPNRDNGIPKSPKVSKGLCFIESNRARSLLIAKHRIGYSLDQIREFVLAMDITHLPSEHCELLLKFVATQEELNEFEKHSKELEKAPTKFGETEQFMYHLSKIVSCEARLKCMAYMGNFDELFEAAKPQIDAVTLASQSLLSCKKLRSIFEIILAFGNYMNSSKKGVVSGFKLTSLATIADTKSLDRKWTLLQYIVHVVDRHYPHMLMFHEQLNVEEACKVSVKVISDDLNCLHAGFEKTKFECSNESVVTFYEKAKSRIEGLSQSFRNMTEAYEEVCILFGESPCSRDNPKGCDYSEFFSMIANFIAAWKAAVLRNHDLQKPLTADSNKKAIKDPLSAENKDPNSKSMASVAGEVAARAKARNPIIRRETWKLNSKLKENSKPQKPETKCDDTIQDRQRGVRKLNLMDRWPWGRQNPKNT